MEMVDVVFLAANRQDYGSTQLNWSLLTTGSRMAKEIKYNKWNDRPNSLVQRSVAIWRCSAFIAWTLVMTLIHDDSAINPVLVYYYYYYYYYYVCVWSAYCYWDTAWGRRTMTSALTSALLQPFQHALAESTSACTANMLQKHGT